MLKRTGLLLGLCLLVTGCAAASQRAEEDIYGVANGTPISHPVQDSDWQVVTEDGYHKLYLKQVLVYQWRSRQGREADRAVYETSPIAESVHQLVEAARIFAHQCCTPGDREDWLGLYKARLLEMPGVSLKEEKTHLLISFPGGIELDITVPQAVGPQYAAPSNPDAGVEDAYKGIKLMFTSSAEHGRVRIFNQCLGTYYSVSVKPGDRTPTGETVLARSIRASEILHDTSRLQRLSDEELQAELEGTPFAGYPIIEDQRRFREQVR